MKKLILAALLLTAPALANADVTVHVPVVWHNLPNSSEQLAAMEAKVPGALVLYYVYKDGNTVITIMFTNGLKCSTAFTKDTGGMLDCGMLHNSYLAIKMPGVGVTLERTYTPEEQ